MSTLARGLSKVLLTGGALVFFFGDRALRGIWHFSFVQGELIGIGGGVLLMILGGLLKNAANREIDRDKDAVEGPNQTSRGSETS